MNANNIPLIYEGEITHPLTKAFTILTETNMILDNEPSYVQKKVFHVMVECLQNVSKHSADCNDSFSKSHGKGLFILMKTEEKYLVITGNIIHKAKVTNLSKLLETINALDKDGLKQLYKHQIREGRLSEKGGAGLGFIDIVRKTENKLEYNFIEINEEKSFFILISSVTR